MYCKFGVSITQSIETNKTLDTKRELAIALKQAHTRALRKSFDPMNPGSRATETQQQILEETKDVLFSFVQGGNQCKPAYSLVKMANGLQKPIAEIVPGDRVYCFNTKTRSFDIATVTALHCNGEQEVFRYTTGTGNYTDSTPNHKMLVHIANEWRTRHIGNLKFLTRAAFLQNNNHNDNENERDIELLGFLLGDGSFRQVSTRRSVLQFTNLNNDILTHVSSLLDSEYHLRDSGNGDHFIAIPRGIKGKNRYINYIRSLGLDGLLAKDKFIPDLVFTASAHTRAKFLRGLFSTDGWVDQVQQYNSTRKIGYSSTSPKLAYGVQTLLESLGILSFVKVKKRSLQNPNHNDEYCVMISSTADYNRFLDVVGFIGKSGERAIGKRTRRGRAVSIKSVESIGKHIVYDITVDHPDHNYICDGYITCNSGKSMTAARIVSWLYSGDHPHWDYRKEWPDEPLLIIVVGRLNNQVEELWERKIKPFLNPGEIKENRQGGTLQYVVNPINKHKIIFATHNNPEDARAKLQSYSAHFVWLDELTSHMGVIEELQRRVQAKRGRMIVTYTPKIRAESVRKFIETPTPYSRVYRITMLDNPLYAGRREELMSQIMGLPESQRNTILYGDWYMGEQAVFIYDPNQHDEQPTNYSMLWPHVLSVDPAASGLVGYSLWAAPDKHAHTWYCVRAGYIKGQAPSDLVLAVEAKVQGANILFRVCDTHETWYMKEAAKHKFNYRGVMNKHGRKKELIAAFNQALSNGRCKLTNEAGELGAELGTAQWSESVEDRIVNASKFHISDTAQYFVDVMPQFKNAEFERLTHDQQLRIQNQQRIAKENQRVTGNNKQWRIISRKGRVWKRQAG